MNEFEENNFIRSRLGRIGAVDFPYRFLEPVDVKLHLMMNTMIRTLSQYWDDTEFKYMKPSLKRLSVIATTGILFTEDPIRFSQGDRLLELPDGPLSGSLSAIITSVKQKILAWKRFRETRERSSPQEFCFLEAYVLLYLIQKVSPFTVTPVGNIYHRMARSVNQGCRVEYHPVGLCNCLDHLDKIIEKEAITEQEEHFEFLDFGIGLDLDLDLGEELQEETPTQEVPQVVPGVVPGAAPGEELLDILLDGEFPESFGAAMLNQFDDTLDYKPNFSISLGMGDFYTTGTTVNVVLTVPYVNYVNFMEEITLPILVHSYLIFKANGKARGAPSSLMLKQFFGMRRTTAVIDRITFYINRLDNDDRKLVTIFRDDEFFSRVNSVLAPVVTKTFETFVKSWVSYYRELRRGMPHYTQEELGGIRKANRLVGDVLEEIKDVPSEIVGMILDVIDKPNFKKILEKTIAKIGDGFASSGYVPPP